MDVHRYHGALLGLAAGDALGTTLEFTPRRAVTPIADMVGGGPFGQLAGAHYGVDGIPREWRDTLTRRDDIVHLATALYEATRL